MASYLGKLHSLTVIGKPSPRSRKMMKVCALPKLQEWEQFDNFALSLQRLGWSPTQKADGPDARSWAFSREGDSLWLVFDDMLGLPSWTLVKVLGKNLEPDMTWLPHWALPVPGVEGEQ
ncbi:MAG: hypothetical protein EBT84_12160 [Sphingomonadaceae bacterium]|nr:hypothetical protein [Sphingomonadaceae bacterium]